MSSKKFSKKISKAMVNDLLTDPHWKPDDDLSNLPNKVYVHPDGRILVPYYNGKGLWRNDLDLS
jgi:hypothetical protein